MDSDFARQYYESASADHWWFEGRKALVVRLLERFGMGSGSFLDLGAGAESLFPNDLSVVKLDVVKPEGVEGTFVQASAGSLPFPDGAFEGVGLFDVLEHLDDATGCLKEVGRVVRPGGVVVVTVPAYEWLWSPHDDLVGHRRRYTPEGLREELVGAGWTVDWLSAFYGFLVGPALIRRLLAFQSPMTMPGPKVNRVMTSFSTRSIARSLNHSKRRGLSLAAVASCG